jgi:hypothetical protein
MAGFDKGFAAEEKDGNVVIPVINNGQTYYIYKEEDGSYGLYIESQTYKLLKNNGRLWTTQDYDKSMNNVK